MKMTIRSEYGGPEGQNTTRLVKTHEKNSSDLLTRCVFAPLDHSTIRVTDQTNTPLLLTPSLPLTSQFALCRLATHCNPLCHFNPSLSDVFNYSSPPGPLFSSCLPCRSVYSSSCLFKVSLLGFLVRMTHWIVQKIKISTMRILVLYIAMIESNQVPFFTG